MSQGGVSQARAFQFLLISVVMFGGVWPLTKVALHDATPLWFAVSRAGLAGLCATVILSALGRLRLPRRADMPAIAAVGLLQIGAFFAFSHAALAMVPAGRTAILGNVTIFWLVPLSVWLLGEAVSRRRWWAAGVGFLGVCVMTGPWAIDWSAPGMVLGHVLLLGASLSWSIAIVVMRLRPPRASMMDLLPYVFLLATALLVPLALWREPRGGVGPGAWGTAAFIGLVAAPLGTWATVEAGRHLNSVLASLGFLLVPLLGVALATIWLGEPLGWDLLAGGALIVLSVALAAKG